MLLFFTIANFTPITSRRVHSMWANYYRELSGTLEKPNKGYVKLSGRINDAIWLRWGTRGPHCSAPPFSDHRM